MVIRMKGVAANALARYEGSRVARFLPAVAAGALLVLGGTRDAWAVDPTMPTVAWDTIGQAGLTAIGGQVNLLLPVGVLMLALFVGVNFLKKIVRGWSH